MADNYNSFCTDSGRNNLPKGAGKDAYPLHKILAEDKSATPQYGVNGFAKTTKEKK